MARSILGSDQPCTGTWGNKPGEKLIWLSMFYGIKPDRIAAQTDVSRSVLYAYMSGDRGMSQIMKKRVAQAVGFPVEAWTWPLDQFDTWIRDNYPGFAGRFDTT